MKININDKVKVKLTPKGVQHLKRHHDSVKDFFPKSMSEFKLKLDDDGFYCCQLWSLMNDFGNILIMGSELPFETEIELVSYKPASKQKAEIE